MMIQYEKDFSFRVIRQILDIHFFLFQIGTVHVSLKLKLFHREFYCEYFGPFFSKSCSYKTPINGNRTLEATHWIEIGDGYEWLSVEIEHYSLITCNKDSETYFVPISCIR